MCTRIPSEDGESALDAETNDTLEWKDLIANITATSLPGTILQSQLNLALRLLKDTLVHLFQTPLISKLVQGSASSKARIDFSVAATEVAQGFKWCRTTARKAFRIRVKVLNCTTILHEHHQAPHGKTGTERHPGKERFETASDRPCPGEARGLGTDVERSHQLQVRLESPEHDEFHSECMPSCLWFGRRNLARECKRNRRGQVYRSPLHPALSRQKQWEEGLLATGLHNQHRRIQRCD